MHSKRRWLPRWQRVELVCLCLDRGMSRREAASYRHVSVSTVQYWIDLEDLVLQIAPVGLADA